MINLYKYHLGKYTAVYQIPDWHLKESLKGTEVFICISSDGSEDLNITIENSMWEEFKPEDGIVFDKKYVRYFYEFYEDCKNDFLLKVRLHKKYGV